MILLTDKMESAAGDGGTAVQLADNVYIDADYLERIRDGLVLQDPVRVVRCENCRYNDLAGKGSANALCRKFYGSWQSDDYCSYGERR